MKIKKNLGDLVRGTLLYIGLAALPVVSGCVYSINGIPLDGVHNKPEVHPIQLDEGKKGIEPITKEDYYDLIKPPKEKNYTPAYIIGALLIAGAGAYLVYEHNKDVEKEAIGGGGQGPGGPGAQ